ncbi:DUF2683 family protein [Dyadobacter sp.]|uniref:DUF2683 family protein n=1 Tax=Dyadobacter sp. TaxID=1914288 RepID=UPI003F72886F
METLIIQAESEQIAALKAFFKSVGIQFKTEQDTTEYLVSTEANRKELIDSMQEAQEGKTQKVNLDDIWK